MEYDFSKTKRATQVEHLNRLRRERLLDADVEHWLSCQDTSTKSHISEMIRQIMAIKQVAIH
ncbi:hypothetical protein B0181_10615 [Moraxella caviae]|uniref:Uncharacterized protein n=1 Tax=Moraxella caviae TaxID=34060 RepID=A0A1S9ZV01_9GAMM|nr:hypothetical protein [Moraxella caviae]OOR87294.1 hypothetical protein B0181_10615 [Moraxella caviae]STZ14039.1 Uncharacterised protein [Moraxella caviae]VEW12825.1 Uncharacterised protein [Moraxella caviae]